MLISTFTLVALAIQAVTSHTVFTTLFIDDVNQGDGTCVRMNMQPDTCTSPVSDLTSNDMACGIDGAVGVARVCAATQGSKLTFLFREWADGSQPGSIDGSHKGPCAVYMKAVTSAVKDKGYGAGWFKIWESGYDNSTSQWCTEKLIQNDGLLSVNIPDDVAGGYYLARPELLALHQADKSPPNPQFYTGCAQIFLNSSGTVIPESTVSIPGYVNPNDSSVTFNIYTPKWPYPMPGPALYSFGTSTIKSNTNSLVNLQEQTEGLVPQGCILSNANWCGIELDAYATEAGCWNASASCFGQETECYSTAPPTGSKNCAIWESKCKTIQNNCQTGMFEGPPNQNKTLITTSSISFSIPLAYTESEMAYPVTTISLLPTYGSGESTSDFLVTDSFILSSSTSKLVTITTAAASPNTTSALTTSVDATCGSKTAYTCLGSKFGSCCSPYGWCGIAEVYCGQGCQVDYGTCDVTSGRRHQNMHRHGRN